MDIKKRELKIQEKRKNTPWRDFVKEICSWQPLVFYRNNGFISRYPKTKRISKVIDSRDFDIKRTENKQGLVYSNKKSFFSQLFTLFEQTQRPAMWHFDQVENCGFADTVANARNVYLSNAVAFDVENIAYSFRVRKYVNNVFNGAMILENSNNIYMSSYVVTSFNVFYSKFITNSANIWFSINLIGCQECLFCDNLENKSYCINNQQYTKEQYNEKKILLLKQKNNFDKWYKNNFNKINEKFTFHSDKVVNTIGVFNVFNGRNLLFYGNNDIESDNNIYDAFIGGGESNHNYGLMSSSFGSHLYNIVNTAFSSNIYYSKFLTNCSYCLGCVGLQNKSFCILNKQYSKDERFELANKIFAQMDKDGILGDFFPGSMNPFYFNDTAAYLIDDSFTKEEVTKEGYLRRDEEIKVDIPAGAEVITTKEFYQYQGRKEIPPTPLSKGGNEPQANGGIKKQRWINPEILKKVIQDEKGNYYRIVPMELEFLQKHGLPLPEIHWLDRIKLGFKFK